jgi:LmbE family N-acetylglucosaminyl deacetylase
MRILAIGAHPDDIELGCGGTLIKAARAGHEVFMYVLTRGAASGDPVQRSQELLSSAKYIGVDTLWIDNFEDTKLSVDNKLINHIEYFIHRSNPEIILTHALCDYHHDHRAIADSTLEAARNSQNVLAYEIPVTKNFNPQLHYDISDVVEDKVELIKMFWSQKDKLFTRASSIKGLAEYRAFQSRLSSPISAVESFEVVKMCLTKDFNLLNMPQQLLPNAVMQNIDLSEIIEYQPRTAARLVQDTHVWSKSGQQQKATQASVLQLDQANELSMTNLKTAITDNSDLQSSDANGTD